MVGGFQMNDSGRRIIRKPELMSRIGLSDASIWRMEKAGKFPSGSVSADSLLDGSMMRLTLGLSRRRPNGDSHAI